MALGAIAGMALVLLASPPGKYRKPATRARASAPIPTKPAHWSNPSTLADCSGAWDPQIAFPQETPFRRTGPGAVVFAGASRCALGPGAQIAAVGTDDLPGGPHSATSASTIAGIQPPFAIAATTQGQIVVAGASSADHTGTASVLAEGPSTGALTGLQPLDGAIAAQGTAVAYLGDVGIASVGSRAQGEIQISMQRHFTNTFAGPASLGSGAGGQGGTGEQGGPDGPGRTGAPPRVLALALDYRTDALAVWWQHGWLYARERHANGPLGPLQRFAKAGPQVQLSALISDDGRAILAWLDPLGHGGNLYLDISAPGMELGRGRVLERMHWRSQLPGPGSVRLVRLSTESVLAAWTATQAGHFVVRAAGIDLLGVRTTSTVSARGEDAVLRSLASGPRGDAVAAWTSPATRSRPTSMVMAARGVPSSRGVPRFGPPERVGRTRGGAVDVALAIDPASDRALACWREEGGAIRCARRPSGTGVTARGGASS